MKEKRRLRRLRTPPLPLLTLAIESAIKWPIMDGFWHSRCLNDRIDLFYMIGSFASGANVSLVAKNGTKKIIPQLSIKSSPVDRFQSLRCLNDRIDLPYMMGSLASGATNSLVAKIGTKDSATSCWVYRKNNSAISSQIFIPKEAFEPYNHLELTQPPSSDLTQPTSSALTQPLSSKLKVLDENGLQIWAQLPLTNLWDIWIYVLHILLEGLVCPLTSPNLPPLSSPNLSITQLSEVGFWFQKRHLNHTTI